MTEILPLGTIVYLEEGLTKIMIIGRGATYVTDSGEEAFSDYMGLIYPMGINPQETLFFNHKDIAQVIFKGYVDEEEERYVELYKQWMTKKANSSSDNFGF